MFVNAAASAERGLILCEIAEGQLAVLSVCQRGKQTPTAAKCKRARSWKDERPNNNAGAALLTAINWPRRQCNEAIKMFAGHGNTFTIVI